MWWIDAPASYDPGRADDIGAFMVLLTVAGDDTTRNTTSLTTVERMDATSGARLATLGP
jgi:hypothetical protein